MSGYPMSMRLAILLFGLFSAVTAIAGDRIDETRKVDADAEIHINNLAGTIDVIGWDKNEVRIEGELDDKAKKLEIKGDESDLSIKVKYPRKTRNIRGSELIIHVPHGCRLETESVSCDVTVREVAGPVEIESVSGEITLTGKPESVEIASVSGMIEIDVETDEVEIESGSGDSFVSNGSQRLSLACVSGDVEVRSNILDTFEFNSVSGELDLTARPAPRGRWEIDCHSGEVTLNLPSDVDAEFEIDTFSGDIDDEFGHKAERTSKYAPGKELSFTQGDGGARITVSIFSGEVKINKQ